MTVINHQFDNERVSKFRDDLTKLIEFNYLREAREFIRQHENLAIPKDEIDSAKGIIYMLEGDTGKAIDSFRAGIHYNSINYELYYNLGYLLELKNNSIGAYLNYKKAYEISNKEEILEKVNALDDLQIIKEYHSRKKILIIAHIFPPSGGSGVQRTLKFVKYLRNFGWEPIVVTTANHSQSLFDKTFLDEVPEDIEVIRINEHVKVNFDYINQLIDLISGVIRDRAVIDQFVNVLKNTKSPQEIEKLMKIPDNSIYFAKETLDQISELIDLSKIDMFYSTSGPYSDHIVGYYLKYKFNKPWIADFRDEWTNNAYIDVDKSNLLYKIHYEMEKNIVHSCDKLLTTTPLASKNYIKDFNLNESKVVTLTNGYDEEDFANILVTDKVRKKFRITHNGIFYMIRTPETFLKAVHNLIEKNKIDSDKIEIVFTVTSEEEKWKRAAEELGLKELVNFKGYLDHQTSIQLCNDSDLLLLVVGPGEKNKNVYPGKIFEYLRMGKRILSLSPIGSLCEQLIEEHSRGKNVDFYDIESMENYIFEMYSKWCQSDLTDIEYTDEVSSYERRNLTKELAGISNQTLNEYKRRDFDLNERDHEFYNTLYEKGGWNNTYEKHYTETHYVNVWNAAVDRILTNNNQRKVIDIGCGPGQFANLLFDHKITEYKGIDFSEQAIKNAKLRNESYAELFEVDDAYTSDIFEQEYDVAVIFEVLEHIEHDLKVIQKVKSGTGLLFSVPNFYSPGHVRWFNSKLEVLKRYSAYVTVKEILKFNVGGTNVIYLVNGVKK